MKMFRPYFSKGNQFWAGNEIIYHDGLYKSWIAVTGQANFQMDRTALTVGGFTQPSVARTLIEQQSSADRGFCQRFLWIFPKPVFGKFKSLEPVKPEFNESIGMFLWLHMLSLLSPFQIQWVNSCLKCKQHQDVQKQTNVLIFTKRLTQCHLFASCTSCLFFTNYYSLYSYKC